MLDLGMIISPLAILANDVPKELAAIEAKHKWRSQKKSKKMKVTITFSLDGVSDPTATAIGFAEDQNHS